MVKRNFFVPRNSGKTQTAGRRGTLSGAQNKDFSKNQNGTVKSFRKSEKLFYALFNQAADAVFLLDPGATGEPLIVDANVAACQMHGYSYDELIGRPIGKVYKNLDKRLIQDRTRHLLDGEHLIFEVEHVKKDGSIFPVEVSAQMVNIQERLFIQAIERDISERKKHEVELKKAQEELEQKVAERTQELNQMNIKLKERIRNHKSAEETLVASYRYLGTVNRRMSILLDLKQKTKEKSQSEVIESIVDVATEFSNASVCVLFACDEEQIFYLLSANGIENKKSLQRNISLQDNGLLRELSSQKKTITVPEQDINYQDLSRMNISKKLKQIVLFPIFNAGNLRHCILFGFDEVNAFSTQDTHFYEAFMKQVAVALQDTEVYHL